MAASSGPLELRERIRAHATTLGFEQAGFAPAEAPLHLDAYKAWLERGWHGEMAYMARADTVRRRASPREALPDCRSIVVVSLRYTGRGPQLHEDPGLPIEVRDAGAASPLHGIVSSYAAGPDYHDVFEKRLSALAAFVQEMSPETKIRPYVDYGPVLERDHAQRAGLGWIGKNTMLIDPGFGSYLLLGELLTTLHLPPDAPFTADRCGTCTRCIEACPTDAIRGPRLLDARRCISYLTIELRGPIPVPLRPALGRRVFGCDICQEVCPWNGDVPVVRGSPLGIRPGEPLPTRSMLEWAGELLELSAEAYRERYRGTVFSRPGRDGMLRNLCVGLGNSGELDALPVLDRAAADDSALVREHARWAIDRLTGRSARALRAFDSVHNGTTANRRARVRNQGVRRGLVPDTTYGRDSGGTMNKGLNPELGLTILRVVLGVIFIAHGWPKLFGGIESTAGFFGDIGIPLPTRAAWLIALLETGGGLLLIVGFLVTPISALLVIHMLVGLIVVHAPNGFFVIGGGQGGIEFNLLLIASLLMLIFGGPGLVALDNRRGAGGVVEV